jgi:hypothetical protein
MNVQLLLNRSKAADLLIAAVAIAPAALIYAGSFSPDAAVYFTFFKNFFARPFSFAPDVVSFGATSPLHVLVFAPVHALCGEYWLPAARLLNFLFCVGGMVLINRTLRGGTRTILLIALLATVATALLSATAQLFETGLAFLFFAWLYHDLEARRFERAMVVSGLLYLIRPELLVITVATVVYVVLQTKAEKRYLAFFGASLVLPLAYHLYMFVTSGTLLPASLFTPIVTYIQDPTSWLERLRITLGAFWSAPGIIYLSAAVVFVFLLTEGALPRYRRELLLTVPLVALYLIFPPKQEIIRYLVPALPPLFAMMVRYIQQELKAQYTVRSLVVSMVLAHGFGTAVVASQASPDQDHLLMRDLAGKLDGIAGPDDRVLLRGVQGQYALRMPCISLSAAVGDDILDVLLKRTTFEQFLADRQVKYIVLSDADGPSSYIERNLLAPLEHQDQLHSAGDTVMIDGVRFCKVLGNPVRAAGNTRGSVDRSTDAHSAASPLWNSVYAVLGPVPEPAVAQLATGYDSDAPYFQPGQTSTRADSLPGTNRPVSDSTAVAPDSLSHQG